MKSLLLSAAVLISASAAVTQAEAAGTLRIEQNSIVPVHGEWSLTSPDGISKVFSRGKAAVQDITLSDTGTYVLRIDEPSSALSTLSVYENGARTSFDAGNVHSIDLDADGTYRLVISYEYDGVIKVDSDPAGTPFDLVSPYDVTFSGITPAVFRDIPPQYFIAQYRPIENCVTPKPQKRVTADAIEFFGRYVCPTPKAIKREPIKIEDITGKMNIDLITRQREVIAGEDTHYEISIQNLDKRTQHNLTVSFQFESDNMQILKTLPEKGTLINGNTAQWNIDEIFAGNTWKMSFPVHVKQNTPQGTLMAANARVSGLDVNSETSVKLNSATTIGVAVLPATGETFDSIFLGLSAIIALSAMVLQERRKKRL